MILGNLEFLILATARHEHAIYGYELIERIERPLGVRVGTGLMHTTPKRLETEGLLYVCDVEDRGLRRVWYALTIEGVRYYEKMYKTVYRF